MKPLEKYIQQVTKGIHAHRDDRERILEELRQHIEECRGEYLAQGHGEDAIELLIIQRLGDPKELCENFDLIYRANRLSSFLQLFRKQELVMRLTILKTLDWAAIILIGTMALFAGGFLDIFVLPKFSYLNHKLNITTPKDAMIFLKISDFFFNNAVIFLGLIAIVMFIIWRKCHKDIRIQVIKTGISISSVMLFLWMILGMWSTIIMAIAYFSEMGPAVSR